MTAALPMTTIPPAAGDSPYVGPVPVPEGTTLHGRDVEKRELRHLLLDERIVLLYSPSGAGKTSLIRAGLLPQLRRDRTLFVVAVDRLRPAAQPAGANRYVAALIEQLDAALPAAMRSAETRPPGASLHQCLERLIASAPGLEGVVLLLDHFEDVFLDPFDRK